MATLVHVRAGLGRPVPFGRPQIERLGRRLSPDNIDSRAPAIAETAGALTAVLNPGSSASLRGTSVCLGAMFAVNDAWWRVGACKPDGSFALIRSDDERSELVSDTVGSHTIWYACTDELFIASTSQRAIVILLHSYVPNADAFAWTISSGTLGPGHSWDRRIRALPPASRLLFDRRSWKTDVKTQRIEYVPAKRSTGQHRRRLSRAISATFESLAVDEDRWVLPLSGGYDSRIILLMLRNRRRLRAITWGKRAALADRRSDAHVARHLAARLGVQHRFFEMDLVPENAEKVLERFVAIGEGRTDRIGGYLDGFAVWKHLHETGVAGVIRGDEAFGSRPVTSPRQVYRRTSCTVLGDFKHELPASVADVLSPQERPGWLERRANESIEAWRDRLNLEFEFPYVFAPLNDLKLAYVEVIHPLISRPIIWQVRKMPDHLRTDKHLFKQIVDSASIDVPIARRAAVAVGEDALHEPAIERTIRATLDSVGSEAGVLFALAGHSLDLLAASDTACSSRRAARLHRRVARTAKRRILGDPFPRRIPALRFAFRTYIIARMQSLLGEDARVLRTNGSDPTLP